MKKTLKKRDLQEIAAIFKILSEPVRLEILQTLQSGENSVNEIVSVLGSKQPNISKHLSILSTAGLISKRKEGTQAIYAIADPLIFELCAVACSRKK